MAKKKVGKILKRDSKSREKALKIVEFISEKKGIKPVVLEVGPISTLCDYFVICSADTGRHARGIYEDILRRCQEEGINVDHCEDDFIGRWIIVDLGDVMVHIFDNEGRVFYNLEKLWSKAKKIRATIKKNKTVE